MKSKEVIDSIEQIYKSYNTPRNMQEHMVRAAAIGNQICDSWKGPEIKKDDIIAVLLIHDLGNVVKMDLERKEGLDLLGSEAGRVDFWKRIKKNMVEKYGSDDHIVSERIAEELKVSPRVRDILKKKIFMNNEETAGSKDWDVKIAAYSDQRSGPCGVLTLDERFKDLKRRYAKSANKNLDDPKIDAFIRCAFMIEKQVLSNTDITSVDINDISIDKYVKILRHTRK